MKLLTKSALAILAAGMTLGAQALDITPATLPQWTGNQTSQSDIDAIIGPLIAPSTEVYKQDVGAGSDGGSLAGSYETTFSNSESDPANALIHYVGGPTGTGHAYLLVKDGSQTPAWYLFDLTALGWNGTDDLVLSGFWPNQGAISHVSLYDGAGTGVPDAGTTLALLGVGISALGFARRRLS
jgi:VPDSG-CTERM motif